MTYAMPCITDSDEFRYSEEAAEKESPLTLVEQQIEWLCDDWHGALEEDSYEAWHSVRMEIYGATQMLNQIGTHYDTRRALDELGWIAFENSLESIRAGNYEGAPA